MREREREREREKRKMKQTARPEIIMSDFARFATQEKHDPITGA